MLTLPLFPTASSYQPAKHVPTIIRRISPSASSSSCCLTQSSSCQHCSPDKLVVVTIIFHQPSISTLEYSMYTAYVTPIHVQHSTSIITAPPVCYLQHVLNTTQQPQPLQHVFNTTQQPQPYQQNSSTTCMALYQQKLFPIHHQHINISIGI